MFRFLFFVPMLTLGQNLVLNPSFEDTKKCTSWIGHFNVFTTNWSTPNAATTDLFNRCAERTEASVPANFIGIQHPRFGENYAGFYLYTEKNYREYVQGELSEPLKAGEKYRVSFWVSLSEASDYALSEFGIAFLENKIKLSIQETLTDEEVKKGNPGKYTRYSISSDRPFDTKTDWMRVSTTFTAYGSEKYLIIGNFHNNRKTEKTLVAKKRLEISYYYIDMVSVEQESGILADKADLEISADPKIFSEQPVASQRYILQNVNFAFDRYDIDQAASEEISRLFEYLKAQGFPKIELSGHTDDAGSDEYNKNISQKRAQAVAEFLVEMGYDASKIEAVGFGKTQPILDNASEENRRKNRRVEFRILED